MTRCRHEIVKHFPRHMSVPTYVRTKCLCRGLQFRPVNMKRCDIGTPFICTDMNSGEIFKTGLRGSRPVCPEVHKVRKRTGIPVTSLPTAFPLSGVRPADHQPASWQILKHPSGLGEHAGGNYGLRPRELPLEEQAGLADWVHVASIHGFYYVL